MTLDLAGLETSYPDFDLGPVDLTVDREALAVLGPSGSGKTTLLSLVAGVVAPDSGSVALDGRELVGRPPEERNVGMVFQDGALFPHMTARENVAYGATDADRVAELAALLELGDVLDRRPATLSGGERQRVALARTLAADPDALLLDEPLSSLDAPIRRRLRDELRDLFASLDVPVLYVTHDQRTATAVGDRVVIVRDGRVEQVGSPSAVLDRPASRFVARFTGNENLLAGRVTDVTGGRVTVRVGDADVRAEPPDFADASESPAITDGSTVTVAVHPSRIELAAGGEPTTERVGDAASTPTDRDLDQLRGAVTSVVDRGTEFRVDVAVGAGAVFTATARPPTVERLALDTGTELRLRIPRTAVHLLPSPPTG